MPTRKRASKSENESKNDSQKEEPKSQKASNKKFEELESVVIRFAGDSGDGMQLTGTQFTQTSAVIGNDVATFPDFPAEIRAPAGSLPGVSGFQLRFSSQDIRTHGDEPDVLVAMNPAALKVHLRDLQKGKTIFVNEDAFNDVNLRKAGYEKNPLQDGTLENYVVHSIALTSQNAKATDGLGLTKKEQDRCKNFYALGLMFWLYDRPLDPTIRWIDQKFGKLPKIAEANQKALKAGYHFGETTELINVHYKVAKAKLEPGLYRQVTGNQAAALGFVAATQLAGKPLFYGSYPITPASDILHELSKHKNYDVRTFQAEDEIAAVGAAIGASFGGHLAVTGTSGPGVALKSEAIGLAVMTELPLVIVNVQRGGPSTGLPTKAEQADLLQAYFGRNGECPVAILAPATPGECFEYAIEAMRIATKFMTPVFLLTDGLLANGAEPWKIPDVKDLKKFEFKSLVDTKSFLPYKRDEKTLARPWVVPGTKGLEHRIGGLEKEDGSGNVSYDPLNHEKMVTLRAQKVAGIDQDIPDAEIFGAKKGKVLVVGWGSTFGPITSAVEALQSEGKSVSSVHLRYIHPMPKNFGKILKNFEKVLIPEMNLGQLKLVIRSKFLVDAIGFNKVQGQPLKINEVKEKIEELL